MPGALPLGTMSLQTVYMPTPEKFAEMQKALADALEDIASLKGELRVTRTERDCSRSS